MKLLEVPFLFVDCQTTGMRPPKAQLLEIAWATASARDEIPGKIESYLVQQPKGRSIPYRIREITGISDEDMQEAVAAEEVFAHLETVKQAQGQQLPMLIHYAQFERPFLEDLVLRFSDEPELQNEIVCSHKVAKKLFPALPSRNIRGVAGFFGAPIAEELKRASAHVHATLEIWKALARELAGQGVETLDDLRDWMMQKSEAKVTRYEYRLKREKRLGLPSAPGVYRMLAKNGEVLYVGKATSLKDRVNSYFRGKKGRDRRKLEMVAQVWDLNVTECKSALEAALLEADEIKRLDPPYNVSLKRKRREFVFYSRDLRSQSGRQDEEHPLGPFRPLGSMTQLSLLHEALHSDEFLQVFYNEVDPQVLQEGWELFCEQEGLPPEELQSMRSLLALGMAFYRQHLSEERRAAELSEEEDVAEEEEEELRLSDEEVELTAEDVAEKYGRLLFRAARSYRRAKVLTRLLNSRVKWRQNEQWQSLWIHNARPRRERPKVKKSVQLPWLELDIADYDRMSVLLTELNKHEHMIEFF